MADNYLFWRRGYQIAFFRLNFCHEFQKFQKKRKLIVVNNIVELKIPAHAENWVITAIWQVLIH